MQSPLDPSILRDPARWTTQVERLIAPAWHWVDAPPLPPGAAAPLTLLPGCLDEPLLLVRDEGGVQRLLSNACTHRGHLLVHEPVRCNRLRCGYHGRQFELNGKAQQSPGFERLEARDDLPSVQHAALGPLLFASLGEDADWLEPVRERLADLPLDRARLLPTGSRSFEIEANWALWVENFLEGFHIPFVHPELARVLDLGAYRMKLFPWGTAQVGVGARGQPTLPLNPAHPDRRAAGEPIAGYYLFIFPFVALNVYPGGISLNAVQPLAHDRTRVVYRLYAWDPSLFASGASADLHRVELQDDEVVQRAWRGVRSRLYRSPRLAAGHEDGVAAFHSLLAAKLA